jgi:hypothetical protein
MLFLKKTVQVPQTQVVKETRVVQPVVQPERTVIVDQPTLSQGTILAIILAFLTIIGLAVYFWWYRPVTTEVTTNPAVIRETRVVTDPNPATPAPSTVIVHEPPVVQMPPPQINVKPTETVRVEGTNGADPMNRNNQGTTNQNGTTGQDEPPTGTTGNNR